MNAMEKNAAKKAVTEKTAAKRITVYVADIRPLYEERLLEKAYALADPARRQKADGCVSLRRRAECLAAGLLADEAKRRHGYGGCPICFTECGQPYLDVPPGQKKAWISISHSGDYAACAIGTCPVGVDLQKKVPLRDRIGTRFFAPGERQDTQDALDQEDFLRRFTAKEGYMKLTGAGMALGFRRLFVNLDERIVFETEHPEKKARFLECCAPAGYFLTVCFAPGEQGGMFPLL